MGLNNSKIDHLKNSEFLDLAKRERRAQNNYYSRIRCKTSNNNYSQFIKLSPQIKIVRTSLHKLKLNLNHLSTQELHYLIYLKSQNDKSPKIFDMAYKQLITSSNLNFYNNVLNKKYNHRSNRRASASAKKRIYNNDNKSTYRIFYNLISKKKKNMETGKVSESSSEFSNSLQSYTGKKIENNFN